MELIPAVSALTLIKPNPEPIMRQPNKPNRSIAQPFAVLVIGLLALFPAAAAANGHGHGHGNGHVNRVVIVHERPVYRHVAYHGSHYYFRNGYYYRQNHGRYFLAAAPMGVIVPVMPVGAIRLRFGAARYHYYNGIYYQAAPRGYVVVSRPDTVYVDGASSDMQTRFVETSSTTVMIKNTNDSETPVRLEEVDGKWKGPNGELYDHLPTEDQLRPVYGL
jgi:hypothetical protein